ncbi:MAG TPA: hypothetical protein VN653_10955 [Anaerolineales bacterium]|nr:hypothetical protein [Anaerolineales bacterium]
MPDNPVTMGATAAWKDCPACDGEGMESDIPVGSADAPGNVLRDIQCRTCAAHHAAVKAAVEKWEGLGRRAVEKIRILLEQTKHEYGGGEVASEITRDIEDEIRNRRTP